MSETENDNPKAPLDRSMNDVTLATLVSLFDLPNSELQVLVAEMRRKHVAAAKDAAKFKRIYDALVAELQARTP